jgi:YidC/Oxa1 family membrane protein insertase
MEKRAIIAAVLMAVLLVVYQTFFLGQGEPPQKAPTAPQPPVQATPPLPPPVQQAPRAKEKPREEGMAPRPRPAQRLARVESPSYVSVVSSEGGKLQEFNLRYRGDKPMVIVGSLGPTGLTVDAGSGREVVPLELPDTTLMLGPQRPTADLVLTGEDRGLRIRETHRFAANDYTINTFIRVENTGSSARPVVISLPWMTRASWHGEPEKFPGQHPTEVVWKTNGHITRIENLSAVGQHAL